MAGNRWAIRVVVTAGLAGLPACAVHVGPKAHDHDPVPAGPPTQVAQSPGGTEFAALPRRPGEYVPVHPKVQDVAAVGKAAEPPEPLPLPKITDIPAVLPPPPDPPLVAAVREYLNDRPDRAVEHLKALDAPNQELLLQLIPVVVRAGQTPLSKASPHDVGVMVGELESARAALAGRAPLFVEKACFCRAVKNYGRYDPYPERYSFQPGALVGLYAEVRNVPSEPATSPTGVAGYVTRLACTLRIQDAAGNVVPLPDRHTRQPVPELRDTKEDFTRSPVGDYFVVFWLPVPPKPGAYTVWFEVRDPKTGRAVTKTVPLKVQ